MVEFRKYWSARASIPAATRIPALSAGGDAIREDCTTYRAEGRISRGSTGSCWTRRKTSRSTWTSRPHRGHEVMGKEGVSTVASKAGSGRFIGEPLPLDARLDQDSPRIFLAADAKRWWQLHAYPAGRAPADNGEKRTLPRNPSRTTPSSSLEARRAGQAAGRPCRPSWCKYVDKFA